MNMRPHHLLCSQGFCGRGYNDAFIKNMTRITNLLYGGTSVNILVVFSTDDICAKCPNMLGVDRCSDNEKAKELDKKVSDHFGLQERRYIYQELIQQIRSQMTQEIMDDICSECGWYSVSICKSHFLNSIRLGT